MNMNRRQFLHRAGGAAIGATAAGALEFAAADTQQNKESAMASALPIVDTHQHLWDLSKLHLSWVKGSGNLDRSYVMKDYLEATAGLNVVKAVYMEVDVDAEDKVAEAEYIIDICRRRGTPTCAAVIGGRPGEPGFREYITRYKGNPYVKGVRQVLFAWKEGNPFFLDRAYVDSVRLLGELGMSFDLCVAAAGLAINGSRPFTGFVFNDPASGGVTWSLVNHCPAAGCGTLSATNSASGAAITYRAPSSPGTITIKATSVTDPGRSATATVVAEPGPRFDTVRK